MTAKEVADRILKGEEITLEYPDGEWEVYYTQTLWRGARAVKTSIIRTPSFLGQRAGAIHKGAVHDMVAAAMFIGAVVK